jgi:phosphate starvation-inducible PhoH-like protein
VVILDEAQNTTAEQMKMFLTRIGMNSRAVITGDITQIDLPNGRTSGLVEASHLLRGIRGIAFVQFDQRDVVRHPLVQEIIAAYERDEQTRRAAREAAQKLETAAAVTAAENAAANEVGERDSSDEAGNE